MSSTENKDQREFTKPLMEWFSRNARDLPWRHETDPYRILVAEKLLQQTTYGHVLKVYESFVKRFPSIRKLAEADVSDIETSIKRLGFQRQRAKQFKEIALALLEAYKGGIPSERGELLKLNGIGNYVADAVLCFAFDKHQPIVDVNVRRVMGRYFGLAGAKDSELAKRLETLIPRGKAKDFNWAIIDFSALICRRKPRCRDCFASDSCDYCSSSISD